MSDNPRTPGAPGTTAASLRVDTDHLGRILTASLPPGALSGELFIESRLSLSLERDPDPDGPDDAPAGGGVRVHRRWETGANLRRFSEGRHESFVIDAPDPESLEALALHPEAVSVDWLTGRARLGVSPTAGTRRPEAMLSEAAPSADTGPWSPPYLSAARGVIDEACDTLQREATGTGVEARASASLHARSQEVLILRTDRDPARDTRRYVEATIALVVSRGDRTHAVRETISAPTLDDLILLMEDRGGAAADLFRRAAEGLGPGDGRTQRGTMPVVFASPSGGFLLHEVCGHLLEADHVLRGDSPFVASRGEAIAAPALTLVDDGSIEGLRGSLRYDDEGIPARRTPLILEGTLVGLISDRQTAFATDGISSGNGRRQSYRDAPMPRMTNLVIEPGGRDPEEILADTRDGLLVKRLSRGRVDPSTGRFALAVEEGYRIASGRVGAPVHGAVLHGRAAALLPAIDAVGSDPMPDRGAPRCVKEDQAVAFGILQPTLRVSAMEVSEGSA